MGEECRIMICVTLQKTCKRLIEAGAELARIENAKVFVVHVAGGKSDFLGGPNAGKSIEYLFEASKNINAEMTVLKSEDFLGEIIDFANRNRICKIIIGESNDSVHAENICQCLEMHLHHTEIITIAA